MTIISVIESLSFAIIVFNSSFLGTYLALSLDAYQRAKPSKDSPSKPQRSSALGRVPPHVWFSSVTKPAS